MRMVGRLIVLVRREPAVVLAAAAALLQIAAAAVGGDIGVSEAVQAAVTVAAGVLIRAKVTPV